MRGRESRVAGHFGEFLQGRLGSDGAVVLVTLPCPATWASARRVADDGRAVRGRGALFRPEQYARFFDALGQPCPGRFHLRLSCAPGLGAGMSTAALVALARAAGNRDPAHIAAACLAAEGATDPLMYREPDALLWASREARPIGRLDRPPRFDVLGAVFGPPHPTDPADTHFPDIRELVRDWARHAPRADRAALARIATESARETLNARGPVGDPTLQIARDLDALGVAIAHTGPLRAFLFAPGNIPGGAPRFLRQAGAVSVWQFRTSGR